MVVQGAGVGLCPHGSARSWGGSCVLMVVHGAGVGLYSARSWGGSVSPW